MDYSKWSKTHLLKKTIKDGAYSTSVHYTKGIDDTKPLIVLVHGIGGDFTGLVPLAVELSPHFRLAIVEIPGHGLTDIIPLSDITDLQEWFERTLKHIEVEMGQTAVVCAHSFGCSAVVSEMVLKTRKVILLNPVPLPSEAYRAYAKMIVSEKRVWAHIYNWRPLVILRGVTLCKIRTRDAYRRVRWVGRHISSYKQVVYQSELTELLLDKSGYSHALNNRVSLVVCALSDTIPAQRDSLDMEDVFGSTQVLYLKGGHLMPIESPQRVARLIIRTVLSVSALRKIPN